MSGILSQLEPLAVWNHFEQINAIPRASKKEERIIEYMMKFGQNLGLETFQDKVGNVIIRKPATPGMEDRKTVTLQAHLDMVHQKNGDVEFDFDTQGIDMYVDGDWVKAKGTTLGADNGLGVSFIMAILSSTDIVHPSVEALFTIDEETGMTGALGLEGGILQGDILINIDTEEDDELDIGCAGGVDVTATRYYHEQKIPVGSYDGIRIKITGLRGGHSGMDIHKGYGNANKLMARLLLDKYQKFDFLLHEFDGGGLRNAIPREATVVGAVPKLNKQALLQALHHISSEIKMEYASTEPQLQISITEEVPASLFMVGSLQDTLIRCLHTAHNGVYRMSADIEGLVETSNNVARVLIKNEEAKILCLTRSSVDTAKMNCASTLRAAFELGGCKVDFSGSYPGWTPRMDAEILQIMKSTYVELFGSEPRVVACHAGLECGILGTHYPHMEMISFGPNIRGAHAPDERASISSTQKSWKLFLEVLKRIPRK